MRSSVWHCQESFLWFSSKKLETLKNAHFSIFCSLNHIFHVQTNFREAHFSQISYFSMFCQVPTAVRHLRTRHFRADNFVKRFLWQNCPFWPFMTMNVKKNFRFDFFRTDSPAWVISKMSKQKSKTWHLNFRLTLIIFDDSIKSNLSTIFSIKNF